MAIKSQEVSKYYIKQLLLNEDFNPETWTEEEYNNIICHNDKCIGYLFSTKEGVKFADASKVLNIYLIKPKYFTNDGITKDELSRQWRDFLIRCDTETHHSKRNIFKNPPIEQWIDTKENWCKKLASKVSTQFGWTFDEALSEVYLTVMKCYSKGHVYMGNLGYIQTSVYNDVRMAIRFNKNRLNQDSGLVDSLDQTVIESDNDDSISLIECVGQEDEALKEVEYADFEKEVKDVLGKAFSPREIDQILSQRAGYLPMNLYRRLIKWRNQHNPSEFMK